MSSKLMMIRSSIIRSLIQTTIRPTSVVAATATATATTMIIRPPVSIYTVQNAITARPPVMIFQSGFCSKSAAEKGGEINELTEEELKAVKNEDYNSEDMDYVFDGADEELEADDGADVEDDDDDDEVISTDSDYTDHSDDDRGLRDYDSDDR